MTITYEFTAGSPEYCEETHKNVFPTATFEFEPSEDDLLDACASLLAEAYTDGDLIVSMDDKNKKTVKKVVKKAIRQLLSDYNVEVEDDLYDELEEVFREKAEKEYNGGDPD